MKHNLAFDSIVDVDPVRPIAVILCVLENRGDSFNDELIHP